MIVVNTTNNNDKTKDKVKVILKPKKRSNSFQPRMSTRKRLNYQKFNARFLQLTKQAEQMDINPYADVRGLPIAGCENYFYDWEKRKAEKQFNALPIEKQIELRKTGERFAQKMDS